MGLPDIATYTIYTFIEEHIRDKIMGNPYFTSITTYLLQPKQRSGNKRRQCGKTYTITGPSSLAVLPTYFTSRIRGFLITLKENRKMQHW